MKEKTIALTVDEILIVSEAIKDRITAETEWLIELQYKCVRGSKKECDYQNQIDIHIDKINDLRSAISKLIQAG